MLPFNLKAKSLLDTHKVLVCKTKDNFYQLCCSVSSTIKSDMTIEQETNVSPTISLKKGFGEACL